MTHREARSVLTFEEIRRDIRHAFRSLARNRGFSVLALLTMAIGIGSTTTLFSLVYGVLLRPLPWPEPDRLIRIEERRGGKPGRVPWTISNATYLEWRSSHSTIEDLGAWRWQSITMSGVGEARQLHVASVTPGLFEMLRVRPIIGRPFVEEDAASEPNVVVIGHSMWQRTFGEREDIIGHAIRLGDRSFTIVGVMPRGFTFPQKDTDAWTPMRVAPVARAGGVRSLMIFPALARLRPGVTAAQAAAEASARARSAPGHCRGRHVSGALRERRGSLGPDGRRRGRPDVRHAAGASVAARRRRPSVCRLHGERDSSPDGQGNQPPARDGRSDGHRRGD